MKKGIDVFTRGNDLGKRSRRNPDPLVDEALSELRMGSNDYLWDDEQDEDTRDRREARITESLKWSFE